MWSIHMMDDDSALKKEESLTPTVTWVNLEDMMLNDTADMKEHTV